MGAVHGGPAGPRVRQLWLRSMFQEVPIWRFDGVADQDRLNDLAGDYLRYVYRSPRHLFRQAVAHCPAGKGLLWSSRGRLARHFAGRARRLFTGGSGRGFVNAERTDIGGRNVFGTRTRAEPAERTMAMPRRRRLILNTGRARRSDHMDVRDTIKQVKQMLATRFDLGIGAKDIGDDEAIFETGLQGLDSMAAIDLLVGLETDLGVRVDDDDLTVENFQSVRTLARLIHDQEPVRG